MNTYAASQRRICRAMKVNRSTFNYGRYGYRMVTAMLRDEGLKVNHKRVERIWREEGLQVPKKQQKRCRLWLNDEGTPSYLRSDNGSEFTKKILLQWLKETGITATFVEPEVLGKMATVRVLTPA